MSDSLYIIKDTPNKGKGMFATRDIKRGELVIAESPLVYSSLRNSMAANLAAVEALSKKNKKYFYALYNARTHEGIPQEIGIILTNALPLGPDSPDNAVYRVISRINHSCVPNVKHKWNPKTKKERVTAIKDIPTGSEILTCYISPLMTRAERQNGLRPFGVICQCPICDVESSEEYDSVVKRIKMCTDLIATECRANKPRKAIGYAREVLALMDKIDQTSEKIPIYYDGFQICAMYSNYELAQEWADLLFQLSVLEEGIDSSNHASFLAYRKNPRSFERAGWGGYIDLTGA